MSHDQLPATLESQKLDKEDGANERQLGLVAVAAGNEGAADSPELTIESLRERFADVLRPLSYIENHIEDADTAVMKERLEAYEAAFNAGQAEAAQASQESVMDFYNWNGASSEGSEMRMLFMGLKPAMLSNIGEKYKQHYQTSAGIDLNLTSTMALAKHQPGIKFTEASYGYEKGNFDVGYSPEAIAKVAKDNEEIFTKLGYDIHDDALAEKVFKDGNRILQSLALGYPLKGAIFFNLYADVDLGEGDAEPNTLYWKSVEKILAPEQVALLHELKDKPDILRELAGSDRPYMSNPAVSKLWQDIGLQATLVQVREALFGSPLPPDLAEML